MKELIKISYSNERPTVDGRVLHQALNIGTPYDKWFPRMCDYGLVEDKDFSTFLSESTGGRPATNHQLTIDMAKTAMYDSAYRTWQKIHRILYFC